MTTRLVPTAVRNHLYLIDRIFGRNKLYTSDKISGLIYNGGEIFGYCDTRLNRWIYQGEDRRNGVYNLLTARIPAMDNVSTQNEVEDVTTAGVPANYCGYGDHYDAQLIFLPNLAVRDGLIKLLLNTTIAWDWEEIFSSLNKLPDGYVVAGSTGRR